MHHPCRLPVNPAQQSLVGFNSLRFKDTAIILASPGSGLPELYPAAETQGHAPILVNFSASAEFLGDVEITAQNPADQQHWLLLV